MLLVAHNCFQFAEQVLVMEAKRCDLLPELSKRVCGFADTLPAFLDYWKKNKEIPLELSSLMHNFLGPEEIFAAHDVSGDVAALRKLVDKRLPLEVLLSHSQILACALDSLDRRAKERPHWQV